MATEIVSRGQKVVLREKRLEDAWQDYSWRTDKELVRLDASLPIRMSFEEFRRLYEEELRYPLPWSKRYAIETTEGEYIGNCMCYDINTATQDAELGIMIGNREYWSRGYGTNALAILADHIFATTSLTRLCLHTLEWNTRARRSFAKCGLREVRTVRRQGHAFILMELLRTEWERLQHQEPYRRLRIPSDGTSGSPGQD